MLLRLGLLQDAVPCARRQIVSRFACYGHRTRFFRMPVLPVASPGANEPPSVLLYQAYRISDFRHDMLASGFMGGSRLPVASWLESSCVFRSEPRTFEMVLDGGVKPRALFLPPASWFLRSGCQAPSADMSFSAGQFTNRGVPCHPVNSVSRQAVLLAEPGCIRSNRKKGADNMSLRFLVIFPRAGRRTNGATS